MQNDGSVRAAPDEDRFKASNESLNALARKVNTELTNESKEPSLEDKAGQPSHHHLASESCPMFASE